MATWSPGTPLRWSWGSTRTWAKTRVWAGLGDVDSGGLGVAASAEEGELGGGGVADVEGDAAVGLLAEGAGAAGAEEVGGGVAEGGEVEGLVVGHCALPVGGWWTAGEGMVGENGWGVNFGGELGALVRVKSFFQKTLEVIRGAFLAGRGGERGLVRRAQQERGKAEAQPKERDYPGEPGDGHWGGSWRAYSVSVHYQGAGGRG